MNNCKDNYKEVTNIVDKFFATTIL